MKDQGKVEAMTQRLCITGALAILSFVVGAGCKGPGPSPNAAMVTLTVSAVAHRGPGSGGMPGAPDCSADTSGKIVLSGVPLADNTVEMGTTKDAMGKTIADTTKTFQVPVGALITFTATGRTSKDNFSGYDGAVKFSNPVANLLVVNATNVVGVFCGLIQ